jgi:predicted acetyltransferase
MSNDNDEFRALTETDLPAFVAISTNAYPGFSSSATADQEAARERLAGQLAEGRFQLVGLFRDGVLAGGMRLYRFTMTVRDVSLVVGGVGGVAVHPLFRKQGVARSLIRYYHQNCRAEGSAISCLYPFRPDFYQRMGYGYGTKKAEYQLRPGAFPPGPMSALRFATEEDREAMIACYNRYAAATNGMFVRFAGDFQVKFADSPMRSLVYSEEGVVHGYLVYEYRRGASTTPLSNDIFVYELIYETPAALAQLLGFLNGQQDQARHIIFPTHDEQIHHLLSDPRTGNERMISPIFHESNAQGIGIMYKVVNVPGLFRQLAAKQHNFNGQSIRLRLRVDDPFFDESAGITLLHFDQGQVHVMPIEGHENDHDVAVRLSIGHFSSLVLGAVDLRSLVRYGQATISRPGLLPVVNRLFATEDKPICMTGF